MTKDQNRYTNLKSSQPDLPEIFKVSEVNISMVDAVDPARTLGGDYCDIVIEVCQAGGKKCERCWNYSDTVGNNVEHGQICHKCVMAIQGGNRN